MSIKKYQVARLRLINQRIAGREFSTPAEIVQWMGFMQAQDYAGAKWSIGLRLPYATDKHIEAAIAGRSIVRSWSFRGTLHFMSAADARWMLALCRPRVLPKFATHLRKLELDRTTLGKARKILTMALQGEKHQTRAELINALQQKKINTDGLRPNFILLSAALEGLICCGVRRGKQFTYTLLDEWLPPSPGVHKDEALSVLALRYFTSHGPATVHDFAWWAGITLADAKTAIAQIRKKLEQETIGTIAYYQCATGVSAMNTSNSIFLLPGFDEYLLGYKDRSAAVVPEHFRYIAPTSNGLFAPTIVVNGKVAGTWKRTIQKNSLTIETGYFAPPGKINHRAYEKVLKDYAHFMAMPVIMESHKPQIIDHK